MKNWIRSVVSFFFPKCCIVCEAPLSPSEEKVCTKCLINLPRTHFHLRADNPAEKLLLGKFDFVRGTSFFYYHKGSDFKKILYNLKYQGDRQLGEVMGRIIGAELVQQHFFEGIDAIVPVPLHKKKLKQRGYNQTEEVAKGIASLAHIPIDNTSIVRELPSESQTRKSVFERWKNVEGVFILKHPENLAGKHILLIDDVLTTGATLTACAACVEEVQGIKISFMTLAIAM